jgi:nucleoside-diphosphate-sugar epimerase
MNILLTGGAGDLGQALSWDLAMRGDTPLRLDVQPPTDDHGIYLAGSILDRDFLERSLSGMAVVVHIAAWHGFHELHSLKDVFEFWELNVTGTFYVFECAVRAGVKKVVFISSTSIEEQDSIYGHTKVLGEEIARTYASRHKMDVITLRPRAFIPPWNKAVYRDFPEWTEWFWPGAVHITDVSQAVVKSVDLLAKGPLPEYLALTVDGAYDFSDEELAEWDRDGPGTSFRRVYPRYVDLVRRFGLDLTVKPEKRDISATRYWLGYEPRYSLRNLLEDLERYGSSGPPNPYLNP